MGLLGVALAGLLATASGSIPENENDITAKHLDDVPVEKLSKHHERVTKYEPRNYEDFKRHIRMVMRSAGKTGRQSGNAWVRPAWVRYRYNHRDSILNKDGKHRREPKFFAYSRNMSLAAFKRLAHDRAKKHYGFLRKWDEIYELLEISTDNENWCA